jgi:hypothetical protein
MAIRGKLKRLEKALEGTLGSFELADGTTFYFNHQAVVDVMFRWFYASLRAVYEGEARPSPPEFVRAVANAKDRRRAYDVVSPGGAAFMILDEEALIERGEIVPRRISPSEDLSLSK